MSENKSVSDDDHSSSSSGGSTFEGFDVFATRLKDVGTDPDTVISHLMDLLDSVNYSTTKCHLCEWVDVRDEFGEVRCRFCEREQLYCDECSSEIYIEDIDDYCCRECAIDLAALATESGKRVNVKTGRVIETTTENGEPIVKKLKLTQSETVKGDGQ